MNIVEQSIELLKEIDGEEILWTIEAACRCCYKSEGKNAEHDPKKRDVLIRAAVKRGHTSVLEHASVTFRVITNRGVSHEWVRHRVACSYSQESTRYCNYGHAEGIGVIWNEKLGEMPSAATVAEWNTIGWAWQELYAANPIMANWVKANLDAEWHYLEALSLGWKPEDARDHLPNCLKTEMIVTMNPVSLRHFLTLRCTEQAHYQIAALAKSMLIILHEKIPIIFDDLYERFLKG